MYIHTDIKVVVCDLDSRNDLDRPLCPSQISYREFPTRFTSDLCTCPRRLRL